MAKNYRATKDGTASKTKAAGLLAAASVLAVSLGMRPAQAEDNDVMHNGGHYQSTGKVSNQLKSNQYKEQPQDQSSPKLGNNNGGRELNPQPLPPGMKQK